MTWNDCDENNSATINGNVMHSYDYDIYRILMLLNVIRRVLTWNTGTEFALNAKGKYANALNKYVRIFIIDILQIFNRMISWTKFNYTTRRPKWAERFENFCLRFFLSADSENMYVVYPLEIIYFHIRYAFSLSNRAAGGQTLTELSELTQLFNLNGCRGLGKIDVHLPHNCVL